MGFRNEYSAISEVRLSIPLPGKAFSDVGRVDRVFFCCKPNAILIASTGLRMSFPVSPQTLLPSFVICVPRQHRMIAKREAVAFHKLYKLNNASTKVI